jgi:hypothetical protein
MSNACNLKEEIQSLKALSIVNKSDSLYWQIMFNHLILKAHSMLVYYYWIIQEIYPITTRVLSELYLNDVWLSLK